MGGTFDDFVDPLVIAIPQGIISQFRLFIDEYGVLPFAIEDGTLLVATEDPDDENLRALICDVCECDVRLLGASPVSLRLAIQRSKSGDIPRIRT